MTDAILFEDIRPGRARGRPPQNKDGRPRGGVIRLLDALPWWALIGLAALTFLFLHRLAAIDGGPAFPAATGPTASQAILIVLAGAGQYLFPALLLAEAAGVAVASRRAWSWYDAALQAEAAVSGAEGSDEPDEPDGVHEPAQAHRVWSLALLNRLEPLHFAALVMAYYRERGMRCALMKAGEGTPVLKLYQDGAGKSPVVVRFRARGAPWVGAKQIEALHGVMEREGIAKGLFMTPGAFSKDAKDCALAKGITLVDGRLFLMMIRRLPPAVRERLLSLALQAR
jgi:hypothetical protein